MTLNVKCKPQELGQDQVEWRQLLKVDIATDIEIDIDITTESTFCLSHNVWKINLDNVEC